VNLGSYSPWFSYSYVDFTQTSTTGVTTTLPGISRHNGRLGVTWEATEKLFITPSFMIRSTPENVNPGVLVSELDTPWEIDLFMLYRYSRHLELFCTLRNLTDHHYALGGISGYASPQETFSATGGLQLTF
jgi:hypothetical protein